MLKDTLLKEAQEIDISVELDSIFESVELSDEVKQNFSTVFETTVQKHAIVLAEKHIALIAEKADDLVTESVDEKVAEIETKFIDQADKFFEHVATEWLKENAIAVDKGIKADLFESMFEGIKSLVIEHNVDLPTESVDIVAELEEELQEKTDETGKLFESLTLARAELNELKRTQAVNEATLELTESQKEKVHSLIEGMQYSEKFNEKLNAIVTMAKGTSLTETTITESAQIVTDINNNNDAGLNYVVTEQTVEQVKPQSKTDKYVAAAKRL